MKLSWIPLIPFVTLSLVSHGVFVALMLIEWSPHDVWTGGLSGQSQSGSIVWVETLASQALASQTLVYQTQVGRADQEMVGSIKGGIEPGNNTEQALEQPPSRLAVRRQSGAEDSPQPQQGVGDGFDGGAYASPNPDILQRIRWRIERKKRYPPGAERQGMEGVVQVQFSLSEQGLIEESLIVASSGHVLLDDEALATLKRAEPLPYVKGPIKLALRFAMYR